MDARKQGGARRDRGGGRHSRGKAKAQSKGKLNDQSTSENGVEGGPGLEGSRKRSAQKSRTSESEHVQAEAVQPALGASIEKVEPPVPPNSSHGNAFGEIGPEAKEVQLEELEVLDAIYGEELVKEGRNKFQIRVFEALTLHIQYIPTYPAQTPPVFSLRCCSMEGPMIESISEALVRNFEDARAENPDKQGEAVVYNWVEWLRENVEEPAAELQEEGSDVDHLIR
jgi:hypothetical protein